MTTILQTSTGTEDNRYVEIFDEAAKYCPDVNSILSFGCSTGEELENLSRRWPKATVAGVEILDTVRRTAAKRFPQYQIMHPDQLGKKCFDMITAMSVLCRWPEVNGPLPFSLFQDTARLIDRHLNPGGILVVFNATYDFAAAMPEYEALNYHPTLKLPPNSRSRLIVRPRDPDGSASGSRHPVFFVKPGGNARTAFPYKKFAKGQHPVLNDTFKVIDKSNAIRKGLQSKANLDQHQIDLVMRAIDHEIKITAEAYEQVSILQKDLSRLATKLRNIELSNSWRLTAPLRSVRRTWKTVFRRQGSDIG